MPLPPATAELARALSEAFPTTRVIEPAPGSLPLSMDEGEALMDAMMAPLGPFTAFKLGATIPAVRETLGLPRFFFGPTPAARVVPDGSVLGPLLARQRGVESEYGFRLARDLQPGDSVPDDLTALFDLVHATIEIPGSRYVGLGAHGGLALSSDGGAVGALVLGAGIPVADFSQLDLLPVILEIDGVEAVRGSSTVIEGGAAGPLLMFLRGALARGYSLGAGTVVATGSCTGYVEVPVGSVVTSRFDALGLAVSCRFSAE